MARVFVLLFTVLLQLQAFSQSTLSMADIEALEKQSGWDEILRKADQVSPADRNANWQRIIGRAAIEVFNNIQFKTKTVYENLDPVSEVRGAEKRFKFLGQDTKVQKAKLDLVERMFKPCMEKKADGCIGHLNFLLEEKPKVSTNLASNIAEMYLAQGFPSQAVEYIAQALGPQFTLCSNQSLQQNVLTVLNDKDESPLIEHAKKVFIHCFAEMEDTAFNSVKMASYLPSIFAKRVCPIILQKNKSVFKMKTCDEKTKGKS